MENRPPVQHDDNVSTPHGKRKSRVLLLLIAVVIILAAYSLWNIFANRRPYSNNDVIGMGQVSEIIIDSYSNVYVTQGNSTDLIVTAAGETTYDPKYKAEISGDKLSIEFNKNFVLLSGYSNLTLTIEVPATYNGDFYVKTSSGSIDFNITDLSYVSVSSSSGKIHVGNIDCSQLDIHASSGKISADNIISGKLNAKTSSGSIEISSITAENVDLSTSSGSVTVDSLNAEYAKIKCSSGKISVCDVINTNLKASSSSGNINVEYLRFDANSNVDLNASSGSITLSLPRSAQFNLDAKTSSGKINSDFEILASNSKNNEKKQIKRQNGGRR